MHNIAIYGGTFDPIHNGHIHTAINIQNFFHFDRFLFLPCKVPVLKSKAQANTKQRIDMLRLALAEQKKDYHFELDLTEIDREGPSYMIDTLTDFRKRLGDKISITIIIGQDSFNQLPQWHSWQDLINKANILVIDRPGIQMDLNMPMLNQLLKQHLTKALDQIRKTTSGLICHFNAGDYPISSTSIRKAIYAQENPSQLLPVSVLNYINAHQLYIR